MARHPRLRDSFARRPQIALDLRTIPSRTAQFPHQSVLNRASSRRGVMIQIT
ncbi:hypothetical protein PUN4_490005 [Paraburkholderia unamae]|nr:hypothetical protein PUN4_490005 [Paraburkholderia unamae]